MKNLVKAVMISCKKASELIDKRSVLKLSLKEWFMLRMHTSMCTACTLYQKQSKLLDHMLKTHISTPEENLPATETNKELQDRIISKL